MQLLGDSIRRVYYQTAANDQHNQEMLKVFFQGLSEKLIGYGLFPFMVLIVVGENLFAFILGAQWAVAGQYAQILCFLIAAQFICTPIAGLVNVIGKQKKFAWLTFLLFASRFISLIVGGFFNDPFLTLWLLVLSGVFFYGYVHLWISSCIGITHVENFRVFLKYGFVNLLFVCILVIVKYFGFHGIYLITIIFITTLSYYLTALYLVDKIIPSSLLVFFGWGESRGEK
jgi:hypothetical protein